MQIVPSLYVGQHPTKKNKTWFCRIRARGKPDAYEWFDTEQEAIDYKHDTARKCRTNTFAEPSKQTLAEYFHWHNDGRKTVKRTTRDPYRTMFTTHIEPVIGDVPLQKITTAHLREAFTRATGLATASRRQMKAALSVAFEDAMQETPPRIHVNPIKGLKIDDVAAVGEVVKQGQKAIADEHYDRMFDAVAGSKYEDIVHFALLSFGRRGEMIGLHWREVHLDKGYIEVIATESQFDDYTTERTTPKTKHGLRRITLGPDAVAMLQDRWLVAMAHARDHGVVAGLPERRVFDHKPKAVSAWFQKLCDRHGIMTLAHRRANFHCLRHTSITHAVRDAATDAEIETISKRAGHASVAFTLQHYKSSSPAEHQAVADRAEARVRRRRPQGLDGAPRVVPMLPVSKGANRVQEGANRVQNPLFVPTKSK